MSGYALVLGGGGAKGSYEIGVWKALKELNIPIQAVTGTSVGALNGAMIVQDDYETAYKLWTGLTVESVINVNREVAAENEERKMNVEFMKLLKDAVYSRGLDVSPLREMLMEIINEDKIRQSNIDFGIVTFSITDFKPLKLFKSDMKDGQLVEYLLASSCFPAFKLQEIDKKKFIDGGVYDNVPISMMIDKKIKDIIMVDVSGPGIVRKFNKKGLNIIEIKNSEDLGGVLDFNIDRAKRNIEIGYYDTLKAFGKLKGNKYYIVPSEVKFLRKEDIINNFSVGELKKIYSFLGMEITGKTATSNRIVIDRIMRTIQQYSNGNLEVETILPAMAEITAEQLGVEKSKLYTIDELTETILDEYNKIKNSEDFGEYINNIKRLILSRNQLEFDTEIKKTMIEAKFLMVYDADLNEKDDKIKKFRRFLAVAFPKISIANMFIALIVSKVKQGESSDS